MGFGKKSLAVILFALCAVAQSNMTFKTRLSPVALDAAMKANVAGAGFLSARLAGTKLTINGTFDGLRSPATDAQIHQGSAAGGVAFVGDLDRMFSAVDVKTGTVLGQTRLPTSVQGLPVAFSGGGREYIAVSTGMGGGSPRVVPERSFPIFIIPGMGTRCTCSRCRRGSSMVGFRAI